MATLETTIRAYLSWLDACDDYMDTGEVLDWADRIRAALPAPDDATTPDDRIRAAQWAAGLADDDDDVTGDHAAHGDVYRDGGWEDTDGCAVPPTTSPDCDRSCLSCQAADHASCTMGCHDDDDTTGTEER